MTIKERVPLAPLTTFKIGGEARFYAEAHSVHDIRAALAFARERGLPVFILGGGSNILVADGGFEGLVIAVRIGGIRFVEEEDHMLVSAGAGVSWDVLVAAAAERELAGLECLSGIPGTVGGAVVSNIGAYGAQCADTFVCASLIDQEEPDKPLETCMKNRCDFMYHDSVFSRERGRYLITGATFSLTRGPSRCSYRDSRFDLGNEERSPAEMRKMILAIREEKGSLMMPGRTSYKCAGSFFHMPFVSLEAYEQVRKEAVSRDPRKEEHLRPWAWEQEDGSYKLAPGFLLEYTSFEKGYRRGSAGISPKHILSLINEGDARARDIAALARDMQQEVEDIFGVHLDREVVYVGPIESSDGGGAASS